MRHAKRSQSIFLPRACLLILVMGASGCDTTSALVNRFNETRTALKNHGIEVSHGKILYVTRF